VHVDDALYQCTIIPIADGELIVMMFARVIFGMSCSPFLAIRTLLENAKAGEKDLPLGAQAIRKKIYVDNYYVHSNNQTKIKQST